MPLDLRLEENEKGFEGSYTIGGYIETKSPEISLGKIQREGEGREGEDIKFFLFGDESSGGYAYHLVLEGDVLTGYFIGSEEFYRDAFYLFDSDTPEEKVWVAFERNDPPKKPADKE